MTRVLNVISDSNIGGAGRVLLSYLTYCERSAFQVGVALPRGSLLIPPLEQLGAEVYPVDGLADRSYHRDDVKVLRELIGRVDPDIVHTHGALSGRIAGRRCGKVVIATRHSAFPVPARLRYPPGRWVNKWLNEHYADHIIAVSPAAAENLTDAGVSPQKITVVMNGVSPVPPLSGKERERARRELGLSEDTVAFGILARIEDYKGHLDLVRAARLLRDQGCTHFRVLIAGTGSFEQTVAQAVREQGVEDVVTMLGFRSDVGRLLGALDVQLNASYGTEATSMALLEGMSLGLPTIASDYGGNPWVVRDGENGLLFPSRDTGALERCMRRLLDDPRERERMSRKARETYERSFTGEKFARNIEAVYRAALEERQHGRK